MAAAVLAPSYAAAPAPPPLHLKVSGTQFLRADGSVFPWRGVTAFRLLEMESAGRAQEAEAYLRWAAAERVTVVRVLAMAKHLFVLEPDKGAAALDSLLSRAERHGVYVEVVALADTAAYSTDLAAQVKRVGEICARHPNALLEIANEPYHGTQRAELHDAAFLARLRAQVPAGVPVALGAGGYPELHTGGDYITIHSPRSSGAAGWAAIRDAAGAAEFLRQTGKPVIDDEPIGAGERFEPGRRDNEPEHFRALALLSGAAGSGLTFHYEGGLQARRPAGRELACFRAWNEAWTLVPPPSRGAPRLLKKPGDDGAAALAVKGKALAAFTVQDADRAWLLAIGTEGRIDPEWAPGWRTDLVRRWPASLWVRASRVR